MRSVPSAFSWRNATGVRFRSLPAGRQVAGAMLLSSRLLISAASSIMRSFIRSAGICGATTVSPAAKIPGRNSASQRSSPPEETRYPQGDGCVSTERPTHQPAGLRCDAGFGAVTHVTATFGLLAAGDTSSIGSRGRETKKAARGRPQDPESEICNLLHALLREARPTR